MGSFCPKYIEIWSKKIKRSYLSWHWIVMQNLKKLCACGFKKSHTGVLLVDWVLISWSPGSRVSVLFRYSCDVHDTRWWHYPLHLEETQFKTPNSTEKSSAKLFRMFLRNSVKTNQELWQLPSRHGVNTFSKITIKTPVRRQWRHSGVLLVDYKKFHTLFWCFHIWLALN